MILAFLLTFVINSFRIVMDMLSLPVIATLPFGMDAGVSYAFGMVFATWDILWFLQPFWFAFVAFLGYKGSMVALQLLLGNRVAHG